MRKCFASIRVGENCGGVYDLLRRRRWRKSRIIIRWESSVKVLISFGMFLHLQFLLLSLMLDLSLLVYRSIKSTFSESRQWVWGKVFFSGIQSIVFWIFNELCFRWSEQERKSCWCDQPFRTKFVKGTQQKGTQQKMNLSIWSTTYKLQLSLNFQKLNHTKVFFSHLLTDCLMEGPLDLPQTKQQLLVTILEFQFSISIIFYGSVHLWRYERTIYPRGWTLWHR